MKSAFVTEICDMSPYERVVIFDHMLKQARLRFLIADAADEGKTIMSGLYIREMLTRHLLQRILIVTPAGLVENWRKEMTTIFNLPFQIVAGTDVHYENPFYGENSDCVIISIDTLYRSRVFTRLKEPGVIPYDLVVFDEAEKLPVTA